MDGGRRLARPLRRPGSISGLAPRVRAGAVRLGSVLAQVSRGARPIRAPHTDSANRWLVLVERHAPRRTVLIMTVTLLLGSAAFGVVRGGHLGDVTQALADARNAAANAAVADPEMNRQLVALGFNPVGKGTSKELSAYVAAEVGRWGEVVKRAGIAGSQ